MVRRLLKPLGAGKRRDSEGESGSRSSRGTRHPSGLSPVLLASLPRRLGIAAICYATIYFLNIVGMLVDIVIAWFRDDPLPEPWSNTLLALLWVAVGFIVFFVTRLRISPERLNHVGLGFEVVGAFGIALGSISPYIAPLDSKFFVGVPWTCVWILAYPLMVPSRPWQSAIAGLLASLTAPLALWLNMRWAGTTLHEGDPPAVFGYLIFVNLLCAAWGTVGSVSINNLGRQVDEARQMGAYRLEELLGKGGMGEVWRARHRLLARPAAVKLIRPEVLGGGDQHKVLKRFEREAQATASLRSPHSIVLYDYGTDEEGTFYYVMEYLEGIDLETLVKNHGSCEPSRVIHLLRQACHSLDEAHANGLIHRDIKPANLYLCRYGRELDHLKILDFGLVKDREPGATGETMMVTGNMALGTPAFMPPEMARGDGGIDGRADLYSLGCVAYWLLTGHLVFETDTPVEMVASHLRERPVPPSARSELSIPLDLEEIVMSCLEKDPARRPHSAAALRQSLELCEDSRAWDHEQARRWWQRHRPGPSLETTQSPPGDRS